MKKTIGISLLTLAILSCGGSGNEKSKDDVQAEDIKKEMNDVAEVTAEYTIEEKNAFIEEMKSKRDNTKAKIDELKMKLNGVKANTKEALEARLAEINKKQENLESKIEDFQNDSENAFDELKAGLDSAATDLEMAIAEAQKEFK